jgi:hypothetical protein
MADPNFSVAYAVHNPIMIQFQKEATQKYFLNPEPAEGFVRVANPISPPFIHCCTHHREAPIVYSTANVAACSQVCSCLAHAV